jgi:hypothetical protein
MKLSNEGLFSLSITTVPFVRYDLYSSGLEAHPTLPLTA